MTVITRRSRAHFARRENAGRARAWMRRVSSVWRHFDPPARLARQCGCGHRTEQLIYSATTSTTVDLDKHRIGDVFTSAGRLDKFCNGSEIP